MGITEDRGRFYFVMRVPKRYQNVDTRSQVRQAWTCRALVPLHELI